MLQALLGVNWKTTFAGITVILAVAAKIIAEVKAKDFAGVLNDIPALCTDLSGLAIGIGLIKAKDGDTTGAGATAVKQ